MRSWPALVVAVILFLDSFGTVILASEKKDFPLQKFILAEFFSAYSRRDFVKMARLSVPAERKELIDGIEMHLGNLVLPDYPLYHDFQILDISVYGDAAHGTYDLMADVSLHDTIVSYEPESGVVYSKTFYLFYHIHFDLSGVLIFTVSKPYVRELPEFHSMP